MRSIGVIWIASDSSFKETVVATAFYTHLFYLEEGLPQTIGPVTGIVSSGFALTTGYFWRASVYVKKATWAHLEPPSLPRYWTQNVHSAFGHWWRGPFEDRQSLRSTTVYSDNALAFAGFCILIVCGHTNKRFSNPGQLLLDDNH